jgi:hypothetical protein
MGLSPYVAHPEIDTALEGISENIPNSVLLDLCDATTLTNFTRAAEFTERISEALDKSSNIEIGPILKAKRPDDNVRQAYEWGYHAASKARDALGIAHDNPQGRTEFFDKLGFDPRSSADIGTPISAPRYQPFSRFKAPFLDPRSKLSWLFHQELTRSFLRRVLLSWLG